MESSGQTRAATLMNAARRSHFVSRIEKYEAKVRHAKALMKEQKDALAVEEQKRPVSNIEGQNAPLFKELKETIDDRRRSAFNLVEPPCSIPESRTMLPSEKSLLHLQAPAGMEQKTFTHRDPPCVQYSEDLAVKKVHEQDYCPEEQLHERGYLSQEEAQYQHGRGSSPDQKMDTEQKEIISGVLQRSLSPNMRSMIKGIDGLDMNSGSAALPEKVFPVEFVSSDAHANIYFDFKPPATMEVNIAAIAGALKIRIKAADMSAPMQEHAFRCARECLDAVGKLQSKRIAYTLKKEFDKIYGPAWHCIVGTSFGSYVTHSLGGFVYFSLDKVSVLLFKTTVEPIENS
ncbi:hypothetical protein L7F22_001256 [Adiantum nelumboides]|nr:hypothetical protein [Adiantum nelumboides]